MRNVAAKPRKNECIVLALRVTSDVQNVAVKSRMVKTL